MKFLKAESRYAIIVKYVHVKNAYWRFLIYLIQNNIEYFSKKCKIFCEANIDIIFMIIYNILYNFCYTWEELQCKTMYAPIQWPV